MVEKLICFEKTDELFLSYKNIYYLCFPIEITLINMNRNYIILSFCVCLLMACSNKQSEKRTPELEKTSAKLSYAQLFTIDRTDSCTIVTVLNPWKEGAVYDKYYLVKQPTTEVPADGHKVVVPIKSLMINSATHLGFLDCLGELDRVSGICNADYIYNPTIRRKVADGTVRDLGDAFNLDIEQLLVLNPQAIMTTAYNADDENSRRMRQTGLTVLYNLEWQENTLLGRAEWIKYIGAFLDKQTEADSLFKIVEEKYNQVRELAHGVEKKPAVLSGQDFRGSWSMPGGKSFNAMLFKDAGADYYYKNDEISGSITTSIEEALIHFGKADTWVGVQANTLDELAKMDSKYKLFAAYQAGNVYNTNKRVNQTGGNDYWESGVARPDLLLCDMIKIFHPTLLPDYELTYMQKLSR